MWRPPPFDGEPPHALWHFSEDPGLGRFEPRRLDRSAVGEPVVWAIDTRCSPHYWFPRECPRACAWVAEATTDEDRMRFLGHSAARRVHVVESAWVDRMAACVLYAYRLPEATFERIDEGAGHWVSREPVEASERVEVRDLVQRHAAAGIELRVTPDIWPFWHSVIFSSLGFSGTRLGNTTRPEPPRPHRPWYPNAPE